MRSEEVRDEWEGIAEEMAREERHAVSKRFLISDNVDLLKAVTRGFPADSDGVMVSAGGTGQGVVPGRMPAPDGTAAGAPQGAPL